MYLVCAIYPHSTGLILILILSLWHPHYAVEELPQEFNIYINFPVFGKVFLSIMYSCLTFQWLCLCVHHASLLWIGSCQQVFTSSRDFQSLHHAAGVIAYILSLTGLDLHSWHSHSLLRGSWQFLNHWGTGRGWQEFWFGPLLWDHSSTTFLAS